MNHFNLNLIPLHQVRPMTNKQNHLTAPLMNIPTRPLRGKKRLPLSQHGTVLPTQPLRLQLLQSILNLIRLAAAYPEDLPREGELCTGMSRGLVRTAVGRRADDDGASDVGGLVGGEIVLVPALFDAADHSRF